MLKENGKAHQGQLFLKMDIQHFFIEQGQGEPLILLHGNGEDHSYFVHQIAYFSKSYRVIALDTRGHGKTPRGNAPFSIQQFAKDLYYFMEEHAINRANLLGFSDGGNIALAFALEHPEKILRLILNGANLNPKGVKPSVQIPIVLGYHTALLLAKKSPKAKRNAELLGLMVNEPNIAPCQLKQITAKTLVIAGTRDMIKEKHTRQIFEHLPNAQLCLIPGNHFIAKENPELFNKKVAGFLSENV